MRDLHDWSSLLAGMYHAKPKILSGPVLLNVELDEQPGAIHDETGSGYDLSGDIPDYSQGEMNAFAANIYLTSEEQKALDRLGVEPILARIQNARAALRKQENTP